jgi:hypothetical protein
MTAAFALRDELAKKLPGAEVTISTPSDAPVAGDKLTVRITGPGAQLPERSSFGKSSPALPAAVQTLEASQLQSASALAADLFSQLKDAVDGIRSGKPGYVLVNLQVRGDSAKDSSFKRETSGALSQRLEKALAKNGEVRSGALGDDDGSTHAYRLGAYSGGLMKYDGVAYNGLPPKLYATVQTALGKNDPELIGAMFSEVQRAVSKEHPAAELALGVFANMAGWSTLSPTSQRAVEKGLAALDARFANCHGVMLNVE